MRERAAGGPPIPRAGRGRLPGDARARLALALGVVVAVAAGCAPAAPPVADLPGAAAFTPDVRARLAAARDARRDGDPPRTRHLTAAGTPRWTNRLVLEASPYLRQHAHNPVDWYPWGEEAFARARAETRPILLSVGYATCHWCHVMEEESFEDEEIAAYLNAHYVAVKVDREARPDVDAVYMTAVQMLTGGGGWPMTVWLTPGLQPFFGGTYFPPRDGERGMRTGFLTLLQRLRAAFDEQPLAVAAAADDLTLRLRAAATPESGDGLPGAPVLHAAVAQWKARFDGEHGGFGGAPKFPAPATLDLLLRYHRRTGDARALDMVTRTLEGMAAGGIHDQLGGGFHRYATDRAWRVPHFEKMLADNAQLVRTYVAAFLVTRREDFAAVARDVAEWLGREMRAPGGGFFTAIDADSEGEEGRFYTWTPDEVRAALDEPAARAAAAWYGITPAGQLGGRSVPARARPADEVAREVGMDTAALHALLDAALPKLRAARAARVRPHTDTGVVAAWNGLAISALARAGATLGEPAWIGQARAAARFVLDHLRPDGRLRRVWAAGAAHGDAFLDDHALLAEGLLDLYEATGEVEWLRAALDLHDVLRREFQDDAGGFFTTGVRQATLLVRQKPDHDGAVPSGNAVAALGLLRLAALTGDDGWYGDAEGTLRGLAAAVARAPTATAALLAAADFRLDRAKEVVIVAPAGAPEAAAPLLAVVRGTYLPNAVVSLVAEGPGLARHAATVPLVADKRALGGRATAYVCEQRVCALPTADPGTLAAQLRHVQPLPPG